MDKRAWAANNLAARLLAGPWTPLAIAASTTLVLGPGRFLTRRTLVESLVALGEGSYPPAPHELAAWLLHSPFFRPAGDRAVAMVLDPPRFAPLAALAGLNIPRLATTGELAAWLGISPAELDWFADERRTHGRAETQAIKHYRYALIPKRDGTPRLLEAPKPRLKAIQRRILHEILDAVPAHGAAHGFVAGRSCRTGAQIHAGEAVVATFDLAGFFPSMSGPRIHGIFRSLGYPWAVARALAGLCTTITPRDLRPDAMFGVPHLPQGAPTSPALANLLAFRLDRRLAGLAGAVGANYTRYADDLAFSGDAAFAKALPRFAKAVEAILEEEGFRLNAAKTRIMPSTSRQRVTGIVVNAHCNTGRAEFDALKAMLHNCARNGPASQNRENVPDFRAHLQGKIAWVAQINPARGAKLWRLFDGIDWK